MKLTSHTLFCLAASLGVTAICQAGPSTVKHEKLDKAAKAQRLFDRADANHDGGLDVFEFATTLGKGTPLVQARRRFLAIDVSGDFEVIIDPVTGVESAGAAIPDGLVTFEELTHFKGAKHRPEVKLSKFQLADFDGDGVLTPEEFGYLVSPKAKFEKIMLKFDKRDTNDDGMLSLEEFKQPDTDDSTEPEEGAAEV